jgi:hypothetical protein
MSAAARLTRRPRAPAVVRRRVLAITFGVGLGGAAACGGEVAQTPLPSPDGSAASGDGEGVGEGQDAGADASADPDAGLPSGLDAGGADDAIADVVLPPHDAWVVPCGVK